MAVKTQSVRGRLLASTLLAGIVSVGLPAAVTLTASALPTMASAQDYSSGTLSGTVVDSSGAPISGATVTVRSVSQGLVRTFTTDARGDFRMPLVALGNYAVSVSKDGFETLPDQVVNVRQGGESNYSFVMTTPGEVSELVVTAAANPQLDFSATTTGAVVDVEQVYNQMPIGRNITSIALLAPAVVPGDALFNVTSAQGVVPPSVSGASPAENAYFINGLNITNFINGLGGAPVPFDFYKSVEVKTGGLSAEFGRATGGVINAVTKSGTNEFKFGLHAAWSPDELRNDPPNSVDTQYSLTSFDEKVYTIEAGGPIWRDHLFFYGLAQFQDVQSSSATTSGTYVEDSYNDPFYGLKLDGYITPEHHLELTYFDTSRTRSRLNYSFDPDTDQIDRPHDSTTTTSFGGENYVARYTGSFTDWLTVSAAYGKSTTDQASVGDLAGEARVQDQRESANGPLLSRQSVFASTTPFLAEREFWRADGDVFINLMGDHHIRFGYDKETTLLTEQTVRNGGADYIYLRAPLPDANGPGGNTALGLAPGQEYVARRVFISGGGFEGENKAIYIQDAWDVNDRLSVQIGWRRDQFQVSDPLGNPFASFQDEQAWRLGATYDPIGEGRDKIYGFVGRYYLPVASNTAFRMAAPAIDYTEYFLPADGGLQFGPETGDPNTSAFDPVTGLPTAGLGTQIINRPAFQACPGVGGGIAPAGTIGCSVRDDGTATPPESLSATNLKSTYEDEIVVGYSHRFENEWTFGASMTYRKLGRVAEDALLNNGVVAYCEANLTGADLDDCIEEYGGQDYYLIINPGEDVQVKLPVALGDGTTDITLSAADLGMARARREYLALELTFERPWDGKWSLQGSYVASESKGNYEGAVKSDLGQTDAGIVTDFDFLVFNYGAYGLLPNHRGHQFKLYGAYAVTDSFLVGSNLSVISPRKYGCYGRAPDDFLDGEVANESYGALSRFCGGEVVQRGSAFEADWITRWDLSFRYTVPDFGFAVPGDLTLRADIFNVFNLHGAVDAWEFGETDAGTPDPDYGNPTTYQAGRSFRFGFDWEF